MIFHGFDIFAQNLLGKYSFSSYFPKRRAVSWNIFPSFPQGVERAVVPSQNLLITYTQIALTKLLFKFNLLKLRWSIVFTIYNYIYKITYVKCLYKMLYLYKMLAIAEFKILLFSWWFKVIFALYLISRVQHSGQSQERNPSQFRHYPQIQESSEEFDEEQDAEDFSHLALSQGQDW